ncbi:MAG: hypothetical protein COZ75_13030 [Flavobacteriaceae bacterium CG_4_8_14_3_um_filter_34_10]|nr:T9SS type A sorting domain-containing protein [Flavobacteriia bacterium]OIP51130.1 MAG: hypothetical protein AUK33_05470 [Flavobacteriaceae bacterium CG2_30_34_30]PIV49545.1 MAG: hypothetical protein COS19_08100 [Flavobacteriaceae bacterium CG02_land_8_20_14_3_00_34_13]PIX08246.1 MAG: hypothetical protein COZ75_13030 [Flavobacteriaceae bacterium CG_4_8_14_3_um_filter_34_10]PJC07180.1 MAG: hypothetical protein CO068_07475 [Flavobacteriaceae bacterium CG_4_9_14_0_8_um_filter_34_30]
MKKMYLFTVIIFLFHTAQAQFTAIPDSNFEQALIDLGYDDVIDGQVLTANIVSQIELDMWDYAIQDLTGIESFLALEILTVDENLLTTINLQNNVNLKFLWADFNNITQLDLSNNTQLIQVILDDNNLTQIDLSNQPNLESLWIDNNNLTQLDLGLNATFTELYSSNNPNLAFINIKNGNNLFLEIFEAMGMATNACIQVDDAQAATNANTFPYNQWIVSASSTFSENCALTAEDFTFQNLAFYPNPTTDQLTFVNAIIASFEIYDSKGSVVLKNTNLNSNTMDVASLTPGIYFLKIHTDKNQIQNIRFVKK